MPKFKYMAILMLGFYVGFLVAWVIELLTAPPAPPPPALPFLFFSVADLI